MSFQGFYTTKGLALAAKLAAGTKLTITKVTAGSGETTKSATALTEEKQTLTAGTAAVSGETAVLPVTLAETSVPAAYSLTELGIYAHDPDAGEILYQVFRLDESRAICAGGESVYRFYLRQAVGADGVTVACSPAGVLIDEDLAPLRRAMAKKPDAQMTALTLHVAKTGSDETGDGSEGKPFLTIQRAVDSLPSLLLADTTISIQAGTYDERVNIVQFTGTLLRVTGADGAAVSVKAFYVAQCYCRVVLSNFTMTGYVEGSFHLGIWSDTVNFLQVEKVTCTFENLTASPYGAIRFEHCLEGMLSNSTVSNQAIAVDVLASDVYLWRLAGTGNTVAIRCGSGEGAVGGFVQKGYQVTIAGEEQKQYGGQIW